VWHGHAFCQDGKKQIASKNIGHPISKSEAYEGRVLGPGEMPSVRSRNSFAIGRTGLAQCHSYGQSGEKLVFSAIHGDYSFRPFPIARRERDHDFPVARSLLFARQGFSFLKWAEATCARLSMGDDDQTWQWYGRPRAMSMPVMRSSPYARVMVFINLRVRNLESMKDSGSVHFKHDQMAESLLGQARLCERIAADSADAVTAEKFKRMAQECRDAAACA
jgi:hypothetical protein